MTKTAILKVIRKHKKKELVKLKKCLPLVKDGLKPAVLRRHGFSRLPDYWNGVFIHKKKGIVIKGEGTTCYRNGKPLLSCPTIIKNGCWIQPLVDRHKSDKAYEELQVFPEGPTIGEDLGSNNCGYWKGVPVVFDW